MNTFAKSALAAAAASLAIGAAIAPTAASAQPYGYNGGYYGGGYNNYSYDPCKRDTVRRGTTGALTGGALGAVVGSNIAAGGNRTEGAVLGGLLGAAIGAGVGRNSAACAYGQDVPPPPPPPSARYGQDDYDRYGAGYGYDYTPRPYGYDDEPAYPYGVSDGPVSADGCTLAESPIYLPDGRVQKRFVRVCRDAAGNYQVVD